MSKFLASGARNVAARKGGRSGINGGVVGVTLLTAASGTFTPNANTRALYVRMTGGGGAGGGAGNTVTSGGGGGAAGGYAEMYLTNVQPSYAYACGPGGTGGAGAGGAGNVTSFGQYSVPGGAGGTAGSASAAPRVSAAGAGTGDPNNAFHDWVTGTFSGMPGKNYTTTLAMGGAGGSNPLGTGGGARSTDGVGNAASGKGGGGGGARSVAAGTARNGASGTAGAVWVVELK